MKQCWTIQKGGDPVLRECDEDALYADGYIRYRIAFSRHGIAVDEDYFYAQHLTNPDVTPACVALFGPEPGSYTLYGPDGRVLQP